MRSPRSIFAVVTVAALASVFALTAFAGAVGAEKISARGESRNPPEGCPPGWEQATHPLNPQLGCLPTEETAGGNGEPSDPWGTGGNGGGVECPEGWVPAVPPLNPALGCVPDTIVAETGPDYVAINPGIRCPEGTVPATPPLNPALGCVPATLVLETEPEYVEINPGIGCPEGWEPATPPLNPQLGCVPNTLTYGEVTPTFVIAAAGNDRDGDLGGPDTLTGRPCPEGSAIHPDYVEYGCIPYGAGPWAE